MVGLGDHRENILLLSIGYKRDGIDVVGPQALDSPAHQTGRDVGSLGVVELQNSRKMKSIT